MFKWFLSNFDDYYEVFLNEGDTIVKRGADVS